MRKIIYDFGSNNGDDIPYYLKKSDLVVAVEANPSLCEMIQARFSNEIKQGRVAVENFVLTDGKESGGVLFYQHKTDHVLSQFPRPADIKNFDKVLLPSKSVLQVISEYGDPHYIKIDIEHYDETILRVLFENNISPPFISAESHSIEVFALLVATGRYDAFKLVEGGLVSRSYRNHKIKTAKEGETYSFPHHSAGPFGEDVLGEWMTANNFHRLLGLSGLGWKDIHATNIVEANDNSSIRMRDYFKEAFKNKIQSAARPFIPKPLRPVISRFLSSI